MACFAGLNFCSGVCLESAFAPFACLCWQTPFKPQKKYGYRRERKKKKPTHKPGELNGWSLYKADHFSKRGCSLSTLSPKLTPGQAPFNAEV